MRIPPNMSKQEVEDTIIKVCKVFRNKFAFNEYEPDDIQQESYFICLAALERYVPEKGCLENFLTYNLRLRLITFYRDKNVKHLDWDSLPDGYDKAEYPCQLHFSDFQDLIDSSLTASEREDYLKMKDKIKIPRIRKDRLKDKIKEIIEENTSE